MNWQKVREELGFACSIDILKRRIYQRGYYRCIACQKPYLTLVQVTVRYLWVIAYIFQIVEQLRVLQLDEVTFLIGGRSAKDKVTRNIKKGESERYYEDCIQYQFHRGYTIPVNTQGAISYSYKSPLIFVDSIGKKGAFKQVDYLAQVLKHLQLILEAFALITY